MIDFVRLVIGNGLDDTAKVGCRYGNGLCTLPDTESLQILKPGQRRVPRITGHLATPLQQETHKIAAILTSDAEDQCILIYRITTEDQSNRRTSKS